MACTCGVPSEANYYTLVVIGREIPGGTETSYVDAYTCEAHTEAPRRMVPAGWRQLSVERTRLR